MTNADKFKHLFGIYATELWAMPENDFLEWLNADAQDMPNEEQRTGRWINDHCSECGQYVWYGDMRKYCPQCGARMEGET